MKEENQTINSIKNLLIQIEDGKRKLNNSEIRSE